MGFKNLQQLDDCIKEYVDNHIVETTVWGSRQGQLWRLNDYLLASLAEDYFRLHPHHKDTGYNKNNPFARDLMEMKEKGVKIGKYKDKL